MEADIAAKAVELGTNTDFSLLSLFLRADIIYFLTAKFPEPTVGSPDGDLRVL